MIYIPYSKLKIILLNLYFNFKLLNNWLDYSILLKVIIIDINDLNINLNYQIDAAINGIILSSTPKQDIQYESYWFLKYFPSPLIL